MDGAVFTITLIDEANRNALSSALVTEFHEALDAAEADESVRVVVVTNTGRVFCAGASLTERTSADPAPTEADPARLFARILNSPKPFVGRIAGHAVAGGTGLAASMDISVAIEEAMFGFTEVRLGLAPAIISVICLPKMRRAEASDAFLRGRRFDANEAARLGIINQAVPADELDERVEEIVGDVLHGGPGAVAAVKDIVRTVPTMGFEDAIARMAQLSAELFGSEEGQAGMSAYLDKRPPPWAPVSD